MRAVIVYESMFGNTRRVADAIGRGLGRTAEVVVLPVGSADPSIVKRSDLVVVGGPTHIHGMSRPGTRRAAIQQAAQAGPLLAVDPAAEGAGLREWLASLGPLGGKSAAFDTRAQGPAVVTGRASKSIAKELRGHGSRLAADPESFLVGKDNCLSPGEEERAEQWGERLAAVSTR